MKTMREVICLDRRHQTVHTRVIHGKKVVVVVVMMVGEKDLTCGSHTSPPPPPRALVTSLLHPSSSPKSLLAGESMSQAADATRTRRSSLPLQDFSGVGGQDAECRVAVGNTLMGMLNAQRRACVHMWVFDGPPKQTPAGRMDDARVTPAWRALLTPNAIGSSLLSRESPERHRDR
ncbi:hypothetical protein C0Q70_00328 [Pomacea canaliculata]|uniref:Uncharacterized protein n=1 Tax=Pomacea canaliculata TaxID=400727 RepID=A0A2T7PWG1_POMCA|nr:hypothetical protein C0Q70_00328 [Pomacea canaliculata]